jgi:cysteinyl-tRNA synthetase
MAWLSSSQIIMRLHNTLTGNVEELNPIKNGEIKMYHCGPTVYGVQHIGNLSMFVFTDILRRTLEYKGLGVKQVINFTDFGHLSSDADEGEDKMAKGLKNEGLSPTLENMKTLGEKYANVFLEDIKKLNVRTECTQFPYASNYIKEQIDLIQTLEDKGFAYKISDGVYYDISKFSSYGKLGNIPQSEGESRVGTNPEKKNPQDFALWKFNSEIGWPSPWGQGFPGWHIECSAMIISILGPQIDIHTGGVEHIGVHHQNEIAQSEAATGLSPFSRFWLHREHLKLDNSKIAKSVGNVVYLSEIIERGFSPLALRYFLLGAHYKTPMNFTWDGLQAASNAHAKIRSLMPSLVQSAGERISEGRIHEEYQASFTETLENDLNTPEALAVLWQVVKDETMAPEDKFATIMDFDRVLGLKLYEGKLEIPADVQKLLHEREAARANKDFAASDKLRDEMRTLGFEVKDTDKGQTLSKI